MKNRSCRRRVFRGRCGSRVMRIGPNEGIGVSTDPRLRRCGRGLWILGEGERERLCVCMPVLYPSSFVYSCRYKRAEIPL